MNKRTILRIIVCFLLGVMTLALFTGCGNAEKEEEETEPVNPLDAGAYDGSGNFIQLKWYPDAKMNDLDDQYWERTGDFLTYTGKGYRCFQGIDVSSNQGVIDWEKVKSAGVDCAIVRVGYRRYGSGIIEEDTDFRRNLEEAKAAGIRTGVYFFSQAIDEEEAEEEARFTLEMIKGFDLDLPVYYDTEDISYDTARTDHLSGKQLTDHAIAFCEYVKKAGYEPGIYASQMWLCNKMEYMRIDQQYRLWVAKYTDVLNYPYELEAWQYSSTGHVDGINTVVDMDVILERE